MHLWLRYLLQLKLMHNKVYQEETNWLFQQFPSYQKIGSKAYKPTLDNIDQICKRIGNPQKKLKLIHVAGSNGKGSTCSMLASILTESNYKVGLFTSPHITDFSERIRINGECIPQEKVIDFIQKIRKEPFDFSPSFFEVTFAMALLHFREQKCDICIIETGLGGRLDATNIISPILSIITNISLEHTAILGNSLSEIATEKAGIIKENTPVIIGKMNTELTQLFNSISREKNSQFIISNTQAVNNFELPLLGEHQKENFGIVLTILSKLNGINFRTSQENIQKGLNNLSKNTGFIGRLQIISKNPTLIFDVSHNFDGIKVTLETIRKINKKKLHIVYGTSNDKDLSTIKSLFPTNASYYFTEFESERTMHIAEIKEVTKHLHCKDKSYFNSPSIALNSAIEQSNEEDLIIVFGSFFLISTFF